MNHWGIKEQFIFQIKQWPYFMRTRITLQSLMLQNNIHIFINQPEKALIQFEYSEIIYNILIVFVVVFTAVARTDHYYQINLTHFTLKIYIYIYLEYIVSHIE